MLAPFERINNFEDTNNFGNFGDKFLGRHIN